MFFTVIFASTNFVLFSLIFLLSGRIVEVRGCFPKVRSMFAVCLFAVVDIGGAGADATNTTSNNTSLMLSGWRGIKYEDHFTFYIV